MKKILSTTLLVLSTLITLPLSAVSYYFCDFENAEDRDRWVLSPTANPTVAEQLVNKWYIGAMGNYSPKGKYGLYISDDGGASPHYSAVRCWSMAYDVISLDANSAGYQLSFDYVAMGNTDSEEGIYAFWIPKEDLHSGDPITVYSIANNTSSTPYNDYMLPLQPDADYVNGTFTWRHCVVAIPASRCDGKPHYLAFAWRNSTAAAKQPAATIDNIEIVSTLSCDAPTNLNIAYLKGEHVFSWSGKAEAYEVSAYSYETAQWFGPVEVNDTSYAFKDLPVSVTDFSVRSKCGDNIYSQKVVATKLIYYPDEMAIGYLNLDNATCYTGSLNGSDVYTFDNYVKGAPVDYGYDSKQSRHTVHPVKEETDPRTGGMLKTVPDGEIASVRLGNWKNQGETERIEYSFLVDTVSMPVMQLKYAVILEAPTHKNNQNPRFTLAVFIDGEIVDTCAQADFNANDVIDKKASSSASKTVLTPEAIEQGWHVTPKDVALANGADVVWKEWTTVGLNLRKEEFQGKKLTVRLTTYDCANMAHCGYAYFTLGGADGKLKGMKSGVINRTFTAPDGFVYSWYYAADEVNRQPNGQMPKALVRSHEQTFTVDEDDVNLYAVDCMFVQDSSNYFTLYASSLASNPVPVTEIKQDAVNTEDKTCTVHFDASKSYVEEINQVTGETVVSTRLHIDSLVWDFGDGVRNHNTKVDYTFEASETSETMYVVTLTAYHLDGASTETIHVIVPAANPASIGQANQQSTIKNQKLIRNGQLFIQRGDELFNAQGARVK